MKVNKILISVNFYITYTETELASLFDPKDGGDMFLSNATLSPNMTMQLRRLYSS
jgi:hypothetical protein